MSVHLIWHTSSCRSFCCADSDHPDGDCVDGVGAVGACACGAAAAHEQPAPLLAAARAADGAAGERAGQRASPVAHRAGGGPAAHNVGRHHHAEGLRR